ncbi:hypothetical protein [Methylorubrum extorquens]
MTTPDDAARPNPEEPKHNENLRAILGTVEKVARYTFTLLTICVVVGGIVALASHGGLVLPFGIEAKIPGIINIVLPA